MAVFELGYVEPQRGDGGGGGTPPAGVYDSLAALFAAGNGTVEGERRLLRRASSGFIMSAWRWTTVLGVSPGVWVLDGDFWVFGMGSQAASIWDAGTDGYPSSNGGAGSIAWAASDAKGMYIAMTSPAAVALWEFPIASAPIPWTSIAALEMHVSTQKDASIAGYHGCYLGQYDDNGVNRNAVHWLLQNGGSDLLIQFAGSTSTSGAFSGSDNGRSLPAQDSYIKNATGIRADYIVDRLSSNTPSPWNATSTVANANQGAGQYLSRVGFEFTKNSVGVMEVQLHRLSLHIRGV